MTWDIWDVSCLSQHSSRHLDDLLCFYRYRSLWQDFWALTGMGTIPWCYYQDNILFYSILHQDVYAYTYTYIYGIFSYTYFAWRFCWAPPDHVAFWIWSSHPFRIRLVEQWLTLEVAATVSVVEVVSFASRAVPMENGLSPSHVMMNVQVGVSRKMGWCAKWRFCRIVKQKAFFWKQRMSTGGTYGCIDVGFQALALIQGQIYNPDGGLRIKAFTCCKRVLPHKYSGVS